MPLGTIFGQFNNRNNQISKKGTNIPLLNEVVIPSGYNVNGYKQESVLNKKKSYMASYRQIPELTALINKVANDACEKYHFDPINGRISGRNQRIKAEEFAQNVQLRQTIKSLFIDVLTTGEAYGWIGKINTSDVSVAVEKSMKQKGIPINPTTKELFLKANFTDEDVLSPRKFRYVASSSMENLYNEVEITGFLQKVGTWNKEYSREEIIHFKFIDVDGKAYGFTPVGSILVQLELLNIMWQNQLALGRNGGRADTVVSIEDVDVNNPSFKRIEQELRKYNVLQNRHGMILLNGKVKIDEIKQLDSMQFKDMGLYITGLIAMQWGIPRSSIPYIVGGTNTQSDTGGNSEKGYWRNIEIFQDTFLDIINTQLFIPYFKVKLQFEKAYKHDALVEAQIEQTRINTLTFINNELFKAGKQLTAEYIMDVADLDEDDIEDTKMPMTKLEDNSMMRQGLESNSDMKKGSDGKNVSNMRKDVAKNSQVGGITTGFGKEVKNEISKKNYEYVQKEISCKEELSIKERQKVSYLQFVKLYNEDKNFNVNPPRVFYSESDGITRLAYRSTDFTYETLVPTNQLKLASVMNFIKLYKVDEDEILNPVDIIEEIQEEQQESLVEENDK